MSETEARDRLLNLEREQQARLDRVEAERLRLGELLASMQDDELAAEAAKKEIRQARIDLEREKKLAEARRRADQVSEDEQRYIEQAMRLAEGHLWYEGTGNDDAILKHQWEGMLFGMVAERWICGDEMGLGKTRTAIGWLDLSKSKRVIIMCQPNICNQFAGEVMNLAPHRKVTNLYNLERERRHELADEAVQEDGVIIVNFEMFRRDDVTLAKLLRWQADTLIVDEAHNLKGTSTANFKYVKILCSVDNKCGRCGTWIKGLTEPESGKLRECPECSWKLGQETHKRYGSDLDKYLSTKSLKRVLFLSGTPILNDPTDIFSLLHLCDPLMFPRKGDFIKTFCSKNYHTDKYEWRGTALESLKPLIEGYFLARTGKDAGIVLPPHHEHIMPVDLDPALYPGQAKVIRQISETAQIVLDNGQEHTIMDLMALITRKRQANVWPAGIEIRDKNELSPTFGEVIFSVGSEVQESVKMDAMLEEMKRQHAEGKRQIVFSQFKTGLAEFAKRVEAAGMRAVRYDGDTSGPDRTLIEHNFDKKLHEEAKWDVVLCNYKTGGTGLNLTAAQITHILDEEWNPGKRNQAYGRNHRIGQDEVTEVFVWRIPASVDTWMANTIRRKEGLINEFSSTMEGADEVNIDNFLSSLRDGTML